MEIVRTTRRGQILGSRREELKKVGVRTMEFDGKLEPGLKP